VFYGVGSEGNGGCVLRGRSKKKGWRRRGGWVEGGGSNRWMKREWGGGGEMGIGRYGMSLLRRLTRPVGFLWPFLAIGLWLEPDRFRSVG